VVEMPPPREGEEVEVPVEEPKMREYGRRDPDLIRAALQARVQDEIAQKGSAIRRVVEELFEAEKAEFSPLGFRFPQVGPVCGQNNRTRCLSL
jgi:hypothetical protein